MSVKNKSLYRGSVYDRKHYVLSGNYPDDRGSLRSGIPDTGMVPGEEGGGGWQVKKG